VRLPIKHRAFAPYDHAHNARIDDELYNQRSIRENVNSVIKRSYGSAVRARAW
jgi:IS5 family transposase